MENKIKSIKDTKTSEESMQEVFDTANRNVCWLKKSEKVSHGFFNTENLRNSLSVQFKR